MQSDESPNDFVKATRRHYTNFFAIFAAGAVVWMILIALGAASDSLSKGLSTFDGSWSKGLTIFSSSLSEGLRVRPKTYSRIT